MEILISMALFGLVTGYSTYSYFKQKKEIEELRKGLHELVEEHTNETIKRFKENQDEFHKKLDDEKELRMVIVRLECFIKSKGYANELPKVMGDYKHPWEL